jgi:hypothetical protein
MSREQVADLPPQFKYGRLDQGLRATLQIMLAHGQLARILDEAEARGLSASEFGRRLIWSYVSAHEYPAAKHRRWYAALEPPR